VDFFREYASLLEWLGVLSIVTFTGSLIAVPWIIARLPVNYFVQHRRLVTERHESHPFMAKIIFLTRNGIGGLFLLAGIAMLVLPGQGIITILIGITLIDFHKKHTVIDFLVRQPRVIKLLNWIRHKEKKPPFAF